jgi:hypothetical protein
MLTIDLQMLSYCLRNGLDAECMGCGYNINRRATVSNLIDSTRQMSARRACFVSKAMVFLSMREVALHLTSTGASRPTFRMVYSARHISHLTQRKSPQLLMASVWRQWPSFGTCRSIPTGRPHESCRASLEVKEICNILGSPLQKLFIIEPTEMPKKARVTWPSLGITTVG